jgi:hypothetical protein
MRASTHLDQAAADAANVLLSTPNAADVLLGATDLLLKDAAHTVSMHNLPQ